VAWHAACAAANLGERRVPHDFRRTAARSCRRGGVYEGVVMKILGHKHAQTSSATTSRTKTTSARPPLQRRGRRAIIGHVAC